MAWWAPGQFSSSPVPVLELYHPAILDEGQFLIQGDLGGSFAERGFKIGHRHCGTTTRSIKTALFNCLFSHGFLVWAEILAENEKYWLKLLVDKFFAWDEPNLQNSC